MLFNAQLYKAQLSYDASAAFAVNKINPSYTGNAMQVRRACDNATVNIAFTSCGNLDTVALNAFAGLQNFPLTSLTATAAAAYSLRKLNCAYSGPAINIRSSASGSPTLDIGFTSFGDLDTASITSFIGSNSAYVATWYDQSGSGIHVTQATAANQPKIVNAGVIVRQNNRPAVNFIGGSNTLYYNVLMMTDRVSVSVVAKINNASARNALFDLASAVSGYPDFVIESNTYATAGNKWGFYTNNNSLDGSISTSTNLTGLSIVAQNTYNTGNVISNTSFYVNGTASPLICKSCGTSTYRTSWTNGFLIGNFNTYPAGLDGYITELIVFQSALSNTERQFLEWTQSQYYNLGAGVSLGTLPAGTLPSAYVRTWFDQSGNGRNIIQTTATNQPRIINNGVVDKQNAMPALYFNGTNNSLATSDAGLPTGNLSISALVKSNASSYSSGNYASFIHYGTSGAGNSIFGTFGTDGNLGNNSVAISQYGDGFGVSNSLGASLIYSTGRAANTYSLYKNGGNFASKTMVTNTTLYGANGLTIGSNNPSLPGSYLFGYISELSLYPLKVSTTRRILTENNRSAYYNVAISNNKYTPPASNTYNLFVNGIGRESSVDTVLATRNTVGMGISAGITSLDFLQSDGDYMTAGINCPIGSGTSLLNLPGTIVQRWANDWYINKTDVGTTGGAVKLYFDFSDYGITGGVTPGVVSNYELLGRSSSTGAFAVIATSKAVVGDRVEFNLDASLISNNFYYTIGTKNTTTSVLPIALLNFNAVLNSGQVDINWATATEKNNNFFTVEKSKNGTDFETLKTVKTKSLNGTSSSRLDYKTTDVSPFEGTSYYRLKQTDIDNAYVYSNIVYVAFKNAADVVMTVFPNPNAGEFTLSFSNITNTGTAQILMYTATGLMFYQKEFLVSKEINSLLISPGQLPAKGIYFLSCQVDGHTFTKKITVD